MSARSRPPAEQWWTLNGADLMAALVSAHQGTLPGIVYIELSANSTVTDHGTTGDEPA